MSTWRYPYMWVGSCMCIRRGTPSLLTLVGIRAVSRKARHDVSTYKTKVTASVQGPARALQASSITHRTGMTPNLQNFPFHYCDLSLSTMTLFGFRNAQIINHLVPENPLCSKTPSIRPGLNTSCKKSPVASPKGY